MMIDKNPVVPKMAPIWTGSSPPNALRLNVVSVDCCTGWPANPYRQKGLAPPKRDTNMTSGPLVPLNATSMHRGSNASIAARATSTG